MGRCLLVEPLEPARNEGDIMAEHSDVVVIGGGYAGVMAANRLTQRGDDEGLLAADDLLGSCETRPERAAEDEASLWNRPTPRPDSPSSMSTRYVLWHPRRVPGMHSPPGSPGPIWGSAADSPISWAPSRVASPAYCRSKARPFPGSRWPKACAGSASSSWAGTVFRTTHSPSRWRTTRTEHCSAHVHTPFSPNCPGRFTEGSSSVPAATVFSSAACSAISAEARKAEGLHGRRYNSLA